ncbi:MAG: tripartite tricarboxylate transporter permease [Spirochaetia bacterium]|nr:tripartite tricarboxylate transporter permease [Spirochaetia bacterium]
MCIVVIFVGVVMGIIFGAIPGLTCVACLSMFLPVTYVMSDVMGLSMLTGIYIGATSGGLVSAILLNIPGTPSSIATCFDGRPMAMKGEAGKALGTGVLSSLIGTIIGVMAMILIAPTLAKLTIQFGPWEYFAVTVLALTLIASLCGDSVLVGVISALLGMMFATVGLAPIDSAHRFTFGSLNLTSGFSLLPVLVGLYAISEVMKAAIKRAEKADIVSDFKIKGFGLSLKEAKSQLGNWIRSSLIGLGVGILPGIGGSSANIIAYSVAKNSSKHPEKYGTGIIDGVCATESSNNASIGGAMIPLLTLGIPGDGSTAILLGGFMLHGLTPGPMLFQTDGATMYGIFASMILAAIMMAVVMYFGMRGFVKILKVPPYLLYPVIVVLCFVGAFAINNRVFDVLCLLLFGVLGFAMRSLDVPLPPFILGFILENAFETNLRRGLQYANGNFFEIFQRPIAVGLLAFSIIFLVVTLVRGNKKKAKACTVETGCDAC